MTIIRKKLIEVSIPLEAINIASVREKSMRHGHPSTLHLWWARRPLAACRAVLFAQLVDDPSSWPERFPTEKDQDLERRRLHKVIERMVPWEATNDEATVSAARWEIARSVAWGLGEEPPPSDNPALILQYLQSKAPSVYDPFSGGGSIPLEAQRLGLRAYGSDLNPVAVLIGKALVEVPPKFAGRPPVNPAAQVQLQRGGHWSGRGAHGMAEDVRYYGDWMCKEAERRIGHLYPKVRLPDGTDATGIAWLWARTVRSPDPAARGAMVPLVSSLLLSRMAKNNAWVEIVTDASARDGWRFEVKSGPIPKTEQDRLKKGTKGEGRGSAFSCVLTGATISGDYIKTEGRAGRLGERLMAVVAEGNRSRLYVSPSSQQEAVAQSVVDDDRVHEARAGSLSQPVPEKLTGGTCFGYGLTSFDKLFNARALIALVTFSDLVTEVRARVLADARAAGLLEDEKPLHVGGNGANAYADAIATYLAFNTTSLANSLSQICTWDPGGPGWGTKVRNTFSRQALPMTWDFAEIGPFSGNSGSFDVNLEYLVKAISALGGASPGEINNLDAAKNALPSNSVVISTDPPYYDNIGYSDLSDFFYVWLRRSLQKIWPELFRRLTTPKTEELVASSYRHGGRSEAEAFFMQGMSQALALMQSAATESEPLAIYYAFKQTEIAEEGITSTGWASFLQAIVDAGLVVDGTWPIRTELANRMIGKNANALASSIVLVCRKRARQASDATRTDFIRDLKRALPGAIQDIRGAGVGPVDMQQSVIGPGMGVFSRYRQVLEDDDSKMSVKTALKIVNRVWEEIDQELEANFDAETQVALAWYGSYGFDARVSGDLIMLANAKNIATDQLFASGVFSNLKGKAALTVREELPADWSPSTDRTLTVWECVQHTARVLNATDGGAEAAARLVAQMGSKGGDARTLAYRLFEIATQKGWSPEALVYNELAQEWPRLEDRGAKFAEPAAKAPAQASLF